MITRKLYVDDGKVTAVTVQDVEPILEENKILRAQEQKSEWRRHIARIPLNLINQWLNEEWAKGNTTIRADGPELEELIFRKINDPDWAALRVDR